MFGTPLRRRTLAIATALALVLTPAWASACPTCKEALSAQPSDASRLAQGFSYSIMVMLGVPATLVGVGGFVVHRAVRRGVLPEF